MGGRWFKGKIILMKKYKYRREKTIQSYPEIKFQNLIKIEYILYYYCLNIICLSENNILSNSKSHFFLFRYFICFQFYVIFKNIFKPNKTIKWML